MALMHASTEGSDMLTRGVGLLQQLWQGLLHLIAVLSTLGPQ